MSIPKRLGMLMIACCTLLCAQVAAASLPLGVCVNFRGAARKEILRKLDMARKLGTQVIRFDAPWQDVERQPSRYVIPDDWDFIVNEGAKRNIRVILILDYGNQLYDGGAKPQTSAGIAAYAKYARSVASHFKGRVPIYEIWNEWDGNLGGPPAPVAPYVALVKATAPVIKAADPAAKVIAGSTGPHAFDSLVGRWTLPTAPHSFFQDMLDAGILRYIDGLAVHPYVYGRPGDEGTPAGYLRLMTSIRAAVAKAAGRSDYPIYITEVGWASTSSGRIIISAETQASWLKAAMNYTASMPNVKLFTIYQLQDAPRPRPQEKEDNFGLFNFDGRLKPAARLLLYKDDNNL